MSAEKFTKGLKRVGQRGVTSKTYAGWHEFAKATKPYALFRETADAALFADAPSMYEALEPFAAVADAIDQHMRRIPDETGLWTRESNIPGAALQITVGHVRAARAALARARGESA